MTSQIIAYLIAQAGPELRRALKPTGFVLVSGVFVLVAAVGLFAALFFWFEPAHGLIAASLLCAAVAFVLALVAAAPVVLRRRPPPPPRQEAMLPQFVSLMARTAPGLGPRQIIVAAALLGVVLALSARGGEKK